VGPKTGLDEAEKSLDPNGIKTANPSAVQPAVSRSTDCAIPAPRDSNMVVVRNVQFSFQFDKLRATVATNAKLNMNMPANCDFELLGFWICPSPQSQCESLSSH
jgi:hypothetical protein